MLKHIPIASINSPVGILNITADKQFIYRIDFSKKVINIGNKTSLLKESITILENYFKRKDINFNLPIKLIGSKFQKKVWNILMTIPYGKTMTYQQVANLSGDINKARAVGTACGKNPIPIIIPCHRVVAKNGIGGFSPDISKKIWLLNHENN